MAESEMSSARKGTGVVGGVPGVLAGRIAGIVRRTGIQVGLQAKTFRVMVMRENGYGQHQNAGYQQAICLKDTSQLRFRFNFRKDRTYLSNPQRNPEKQA